MREIEWPTIGVAAAVYGMWLAAVVTHAGVPAAVTIGALAVAICWQGSLQHEVLHGHPFRTRGANDALGWPPLSLRLPYLAYRRFHLAHHATDDLTDPGDDVESFYVSTAVWADTGRLRRAFLLAHHTLVGRLVLGPPCEVLSTLVWHARLIRRGDRTLARWWAAHLLGVAVLLTLVVGRFGLPLWQYLVAGYLAHSLTLVRSFAEHRWVAGGASRSAVIDGGRFWRLLFLNNNLHLTHHDHPGEPWYRLPALESAGESAARAMAGAGHYGGYGEIFRRYALRPIDSPVHPASPPRAVTGGR